MAETELERAEKKFAQAKARLQGLRNREATRLRKMDTRRKVILGGALMDLADARHRRRRHARPAAAQPAPRPGPRGLRGVEPRRGRERSAVRAAVTGRARRMRLPGLPAGP